MSELTHTDEGGQAHMVDVGTKPSTRRVAVASGYISMQHETLNMVVENTNKKGDVLAVARIAGIMASKKTSELVPLCHQVALTKIDIQLDVDKDIPGILCTASAYTHGPTGVEIEALTAVQISLLTVYDMCKAVDRGMTINRVHLAEKSGGQSGTWKKST